MFKTRAPSFKKLGGARSFKEQWDWPELSRFLSWPKLLSCFLGHNRGALIDSLVTWTTRSPSFLSWSVARVGVKQKHTYKTNKQTNHEWSVGAQSPGERGLRRRRTNLSLFWRNPGCFFKWESTLCRTSCDGGRLFSLKFNYLPVCL